MLREDGALIDRNFPALRISLPYSTKILRPKLQALYSLLTTIEESLFQASDPAVSTAKLSWWYEELKRTRSGQGNHPLSLQLHSSGALAAWPDALLERLFKLAIQRIDAPGVNDTSGLLELCKSLGTIQLELETSLQHGSPADQEVIWNLASINGLLQLFRESFNARRASYYWVPLTECARLGVDRSEMTENPSGEALRLIFISMVDRIVGQLSQPVNVASMRALPQPWASENRHWLVLSSLQQRQLLRLRLGMTQFKNSLNTIGLLNKISVSDGWHAWRLARRFGMAATK